MHPSFRKEKKESHSPKRGAQRRRAGNMKKNRSWPSKIPEPWPRGRFKSQRGYSLVAHFLCYAKRNMQGFNTGKGNNLRQERKNWGTRGSCLKVTGPTAGGGTYLVENWRKAFVPTTLTEGNQGRGRENGLRVRA